MCDDNSVLRVPITPSRDTLEHEAVIIIDIYKNQNPTQRPLSDIIRSETDGFYTTLHFLSCSSKEEREKARQEIFEATREPLDSIDHILSEFAYYIMKQYVQKEDPDASIADYDSTHPALPSNSI